MNKRIKYIISLLVILLVLSCGKSDANQQDVVSASETDGSTNNNELINISKEQFQNENMKLLSIKDHSFPTSVKTTGMIDVPPNSKAIISAYAGGYIKRTPFLIGDKVKKGQALVTIENLDFVQMQQDYLEVSEQLNYLKTDYDRQKELFDENISSKKSFLKAESEYRKANAMYNGLRKKLQILNIDPATVEQGEFSSVTTIYSPISGSITEVNINTGTYVSPADRIMEIVNTDHIHLELVIFEKDILKIKKGQKVAFKIPEFSDENFEGEIHLIGKSIGENRTIQVHAHIDHDTKHNFIVGMFVEADIIIEDNSAKALPEDAIIEVGGKNYILILRSDDKGSYSFAKEEIKIGKTYKGLVEVIDSLKASDKYLSGAYNLISEEE